MKMLVEGGEKVWYRSRDQIINQKRSKMGNYSNTWFLRGENTSVLNTMATPSGDLVRKLREGLRHHKAPDRGSTLVVEMGGISVTSGLFKADPIGSKACPWVQQCPIIEGHSCTQSRVVYELECALCPGRLEGYVPEGGGREGEGHDNLLLPNIYRGQTGCSGHRRALQHLEAIARGAETSGMAEHMKRAHPGAAATPGLSLLRMRVLGSKARNMERSILEAYKIEELEKEPNVIALNKKAEWGRTALRRLAVTQD